jgi:hypothetical protein
MQNKTLIDMSIKSSRQIERTNTSLYVAYSVLRWIFGVGGGRGVASSHRHHIGRQMRGSLP